MNVSLPTPPCTANEIVVIYSTQWGKYWEADGNGYTNDVDRAGRYHFYDAVLRTQGCGPEKGLQIHRVVEKRA